MFRLFLEEKVAELLNILFAEESVLDIIQGTYKINGNFATENRLIFIDKGLCLGLKLKIFHMTK
jgi:hypothetical protein